MLAAGQSSRMGQSKIVLPWGKNTVIGKVIQTFLDAGIAEIVIVTGGYRDLVEKEISHYPVKRVFNPNYSNGEMADSVKCGLSMLSRDCDAVFIALGDQPGLSSTDIRGMIEALEISPECLILPSYTMRRGHPWLIPHKYFSELNELKFPLTLRDFIKTHESELKYYLVKESDILSDLDTPEDYQKLKPE